MKKLFPVIHIKDVEQVFAQLEICVRNKVDGVFLIHHRKRYGAVAQMAYVAQQKFPDLWVGVNALDLTPVRAFSMKWPSNVKAIWSDLCGVYEEQGDFNVTEANEIQFARRNSNPKLEFFASFAFKYQAPVKDLIGGARTVRSYCSTVVTSGDGTGIAADVEKVATIHHGLKCWARLGLASGVTPDNVDNYLRYVDDYLVATGIGKDFHTIDEEKLRALQEKLKTA